MTYSPAYYAELTRLLNKLTSLFPHIPVVSLPALMGSLLFNYNRDFEAIHTAINPYGMRIVLTDRRNVTG